MSRRLCVLCAVMTLVCSGAVIAQRAPQTRPPLFLSEGWKALTTPPDDHGAWPASQGGVASPNLQLTLHGTSGKEIQLVSVRGSGRSLSAESVDRHDHVAERRLASRPHELRGPHRPLAKIRWTVRTSGFHQVRPIVKLADGTWLVGDQATGPSLDFNQTDVSIADLRWIKLDIARVVAVGNWIEHPDLTKVDEVGFADLMPGSGHGPGGYVNVGRIEVYGRPVKR